MICPHCDGTGKVTAEQLGFGGMVTRARKNVGMTQAELAGRIGLSRAQIANIEGGRSSVPVEAVREYAAILRIDPLELLP